MLASLSALLLLLIALFFYKKLILRYLSLVLQSISIFDEEDYFIACYFIYVYFIQNIIWNTSLSWLQQREVKGCELLAWMSACWDGGLGSQDTSRVASTFVVSHCGACSSTVGLHFTAMSGNVFDRICIQLNCVLSRFAATCGHMHVHTYLHVYCSRWHIRRQAEYSKPVVHETFFYSDFLTKSDNYAGIRYARETDSWVCKTKYFSLLSS